MINAILMSVLLAAALAVFAALVIPRFRLLLAVRGEQRFDRIGARIGGVVKFALAQWKMPRDPAGGFAHIFIFFGFLAVAIGTITHFGRAYDPHFLLPGFAGAVGQVYTLIKDIFEGLVIVGVTYGLWRRLKPTPSRVGRSWEGVFVLCMILFLMVTDYIVAGAETVANPDAAMPYNPGGYLLAMALAPLGEGTAHVIGVGAWWLHCAAVLVFLNFLPIGKHFHVITAIPNVFFRNLEPRGAGKKEADLIEAMEKDDFETIEKLGIGTTADMTWPMVLDVYSCTECGRCSVFCPTVLTGKPLEHRQLNKDLKAALYADKPLLLAGDEKKREELPELVGGKIDPETVWACTTCGSCEEECPVLIENVPRIIEMRKKQVMAEAISPELQRAYKGLENNYNPWGLGYDQRDAWAEGLDIPRMADVAGNGKEAPLLYWVGCAGSYDDRIKKVTIAMVQIMRAAGVEFAILGAEEQCTGDSARRTGNEFLFQMLAQANVEILNGYGVKRIVTHCPHCLHTLMADYPQFGGNYEVIHHTQLIDELIKSGKLKLSGKFEKSVAWHDSCYLGRYHDIYEAPRSVVKAAGTSLVEMPRAKSRGVCCGAGGGRFWMEETIGERINAHRAKEAVGTKAACVGTSCPFCLTMLKDGVADLGKDEEVQTLDVAEIVAKAL